ncbi:hypothetical protein [Streptomyces albiaxialis]|uniref:hypothetical protein n=1 Tax=Streptomyces albiaxialis TaxID=329523 RepID=UPI0031D6E634
MTSNGEDLVLAVDFAVSGRPQAGFPDFAALARPQFSLWETLPPAPEEDADMTGVDYVERWAEDALRQERPVKAVMGYCAGAVYAAALAERIGERQGVTPALIGFDPEPPRGDVICHHFGTTMEGMSGLLKPEEIAHAQQAAARALADETDIKKLGDRLLEIFRDVGGAAFARVGLDAKRSEEFVATFGLFLHFFVRGSDLDPTEGWKALTAMTSATPTSGLNPLSEEARADRVAKEIRFSVEHADLLRTPDVATTVTGLLS